MKYSRFLLLAAATLTLSVFAGRFPIEGESGVYFQWQKQSRFYSVTAVKPSADGWRFSSGNKSDQAFIYNKPVRAIKGGKVIACWRGAPDNEKAGNYHEALGLATDEVDTRIPEYGNHLLIQHVDGSRTLYAYLQEQTIPKTLCPNNEPFLTTPVPAPDSPEVKVQTAVSGSVQPTVSEGLFLGRVGNSGKSDTTQLAIRYEKDGKLAPIQFDNGLFSMNAMKEEFLKWQPIDGRAIPLETAFFWPVRPLVNDLPKNKLLFEEHERLFPWLTESGFWPAYSDVYRVGDKTYVNISWRPTKAPWLMYGLLTAQQHQQTMEQAFIEGYSLKAVDTTLINGQLRFFSVFVQDLAQVLTRHSMTLADFNKLKYEARKKQFGAAAISVQYKNKEPIITALFRPDVQGQQEYYHAINVDKYEEYYEQMAKKNLYPVYVNGFSSHLGKMASVIFAQRFNTGLDEYEMDLSDLKDNHKEANEQGYVTGMISGYDNVEEDHAFIGFWEKVAQ